MRTTLPTPGGHHARAPRHGDCFAANCANCDPPHNARALLHFPVGWANVGYHRTPADDPKGEVQTPTMDSLCREGVELNQSYAFWYCSPSRSAIQTGRNPIHVNVNNDGLMIHNPADPVSGFAGIPRNMTTIAWKMREAGYHTYFYGKWHVSWRARNRRGGRAAAELACARAKLTRPHPHNNAPSRLGSRHPTTRQPAAVGRPWLMIE